MRCPFCSTHEDKVMETRVSKDGGEIRRRRECEGCQRRYTTYERIEESMPLVVKNDGSRQSFDRNKIERGIRAAVVKRKVTVEQIQAIAETVEREIGELGVPEIASRDIGERVLPKLRALDQVAFVRFASIYRDFGDLDGFVKEVDALRGEDTGRHAMAMTDEGAPRIATTTDVVPAIAVASSPNGHDTAAIPELTTEEPTDEHELVALPEP